MKTVIEKATGKVLYATYMYIETDEVISIDALLTDLMENPYWDFEKQIFYNNDNNL